MKKQERHQMICNLVETRNIETQEDLANALRECGYRVTQATVSRDIKELMLVKVPDMWGGYRYSVPKERNAMMSSEQLERLVRHSVISIRSGGNLVVFHTLPGTAQGVAYAIDSMKWVGVMGTVAGDDTIFVAIDRPEVAEEFISYFQFKNNDSKGR
jgi:transcriptional regulator of arginine metabolism